MLEYEERLCHYHDLGIYRLLNYPENSWPVNQMLGEMDELLNQMDEEKRDTLAMTGAGLCQVRIQLPEDGGPALHSCQYGAVPD